VGTRRAGAEIEVAMVMMVVTVGVVVIVPMRVIVVVTMDGAIVMSMGVFVRPAFDPDFAVTASANCAHSCLLVIR
jgi:hypothetical protein